MCKLPLISVGCGRNTIGSIGGGFWKVVGGSGSSAFGAGAGAGAAGVSSIPEADGPALLSSLSPSPASVGGPGIGVSPFFKHVWMYAALYFAYLRLSVASSLNSPNVNNAS